MDGSPIAAAAVLAVPAPVRARRSVLAGPLSRGAHRYFSKKEWQLKVDEVDRAGDLVRASIGGC